MDFVRAAIEIIKLLCDPLCHQISYVWMFRKNLTELKRQRDSLVCKEQDVRDEIARAELHRKVPTNVVQRWLKGVADVKTVLSEIENDENKMCFSNSIPDYCWRRKVSKRSLELIGELKRLITECPSKDDVACEALPASKIAFPAARLFGEEPYKKQIWKCLEDENIERISVYGMGGVGKTAIMKLINNDLKNDKRFENVLWVTVSKEELNLKRLQSDIAEALRLGLSEEQDEKIRSRELFQYFSKRRKFVLILDDLWQAFSLEDIGIPEPDKEHGCKLVVTTRLLNVCDGMETQKNIEVRPLCEAYAWDLFSSKVENDVLSNPEILEVANRVAKECDGLPLALITVGRALRNAKDVCVWRHALKELRESIPKSKVMGDKVFQLLKFSYMRLRDDDVRACFLYCSLFPEDFTIKREELILLWQWEGLVKEDGVVEVMNEGYFILNELISACMLEWVPFRYGKSAEGVKMHDLIRDMAIGITRDSPRFTVKSRVGLKELPKAEEFVENIERISLSYNCISSLIGQPNCPNLRTLFLEYNFFNYSESFISPSFFLYMHSLRVLDLSRTCFKALPESLSNLVNLHALVLESCNLVVLPSFAKLKELRILKLRYTRIEELPPGMECLIKLRYLDLSWTQLKTIGVGIFRQLSALEELSLEGIAGNFDLMNREARIILSEILELKKLNKLSIVCVGMRFCLIEQESDLWRSMHKFVCSIGWTKERDDAFCSEGVVYMRPDDTNRCSVLRFGDPYLHIQRCWCNLVIPQALIVSIAFKRLEIQSCKCTQYIFESGEDYFISAIETLTVRSVDNLKSFSKEVIPCGALANLRNLYFDNCLNLEALFSSDVLRCLQNIEVIGICYCFKMKQMVVEEANGAEDACEVENITVDAISLPRLRELELSGLTKLKCICKRMLICNSLQQIKLEGCPDMSSLCLSIENQAAKVDGFIKGSRDWWNALQWEDLNTERILQPLFKEEKDWWQEMTRVDSISQV